MNRLFEMAWVIARRDFVATVMSRTFILFLAAPLFVLAFAVLVGELSRQTDQAVAQPTIAVVSDSVTAELVRESRAEFADAMGAFSVPDFRTVEPETNIPAQITRLLGSEEENVTAVLSGDLARPVLTAPKRTIDMLAGEVSLIVNDARRRAAMEDAGLPLPAEQVRTVVSGPAAGNLILARHGLARGGQILVLTLGLMLAGMMLSSLVEEKSNKVIEVLSASAPIEAIFLGKLIGMLGVSLVGITVWGSLAGFGLFLLRDVLGGAVDPAVGWPAYALLLMIYFSINYMLVGAVFLVVGGQAMNMKDVQTMSMPATFSQLGLFALAGAAVSGASSTLYWIAVVFPLSSPLAMVAVAAQNGALWPHLLAILWQLAWVALIIRISARMFRRSVLKSGKSGEPLLGFLKRKKA